MVLGISNDLQHFDQRYKFLKKSHISPPKCFIPTLLESPMVVFWGFSFSKCDQSYYRDYFAYISSLRDDDSRRNIYFVCYDSESQAQCLSNVEEILNGNITNLCVKNYVEWVKTDRYVDSKNFAKMLLSFRS